MGELVNKNNTVAAKAAVTNRRRRYAIVQEYPGSWTDQYLSELMLNGGQVGKACEVCMVSKTTLDTWRKTHSKFSEEERDIRREIRHKQRDELEAEIFRRATVGDVVKTFDKNGKETGERHKRSDVLAMFMMKRLDPRYRDTVQHSGTVKHQHVLPLVIVEIDNKESAQKFLNDPGKVIDGKMVGHKLIDDGTKDGDG